MTRVREKIEYLIGPTNDGITHYTWTMIVTQGNGSYHRDYDAQTWCGVQAPKGHSMLAEGIVTCLACATKSASVPGQATGPGFKLYETLPRSIP